MGNWPVEFREGLTRRFRPGDRVFGLLRSSEIIGLAIEEASALAANDGSTSLGSPASSLKTASLMRSSALICQVAPSLDRSQRNFSKQTVEKMPRLCEGSEFCVRGPEIRLALTSQGQTSCLKQTASQAASPRDHRHPFAKSRLMLSLGYGTLAEQSELELSVAAGEHQPGVGQPR